MVNKLNREMGRNTIRLSGQRDAVWQLRRDYLQRYTTEWGKVSNHGARRHVATQLQLPGLQR
ncbi:DUF4113 domain-containing protein [Chromohalobacter canadensis]|uniref:DUF4113 domain-containing protein n=1 Tax=Chromohalobacter canadensis TaxID=141389 RepID=UPI003D697ACA